MEPLFRTSALLGAHVAAVYPDRLTHRQAGKNEQAIPILQIESATPAGMGASAINVKLLSGRNILVIVKGKDKKQICDIIMETKAAKIEQDKKDGITHDHDPLWEPQVSCPRCGSTQITAQKKGWTLTTGFIGSKKIFITCLACGHRFRPGA